jgi:hypothetical protein
MGKRRDNRLRESAQRLMQPAETVELMAIAKLGETGATVTKTVVASAAAAVVAAAVTGGVGFVGFARREIYLVLTDQQLLFFEAIRQTGGPGKHLASFPRERVTVSDFKDGALFLNVHLAIRDTDALRLTFPPIPRANRLRGRAFAKALPKSGSIVEG